MVPPHHPVVDMATVIPCMCTMCVHVSVGVCVGGCVGGYGHKCVCVRACACTHAGAFVYNSVYKLKNYKANCLLTTNLKREYFAVHNERNDPIM